MKGRHCEAGRKESPSMKRHCIWTSCCLFALYISAPIAHADVTVRECIKFPTGVAQAWYLPPSSGWKHLGYLTFNHLTSSDYVVTALVGLHEGNVAGTEVEYQITLDGAPHGWYVRRVPAGYPTSQVIRSVIANVSAGQHVLGLRARNLSTTQGVKYEMFWLTPLLVNGTETTKLTSTTTATSVGSAWTTVLQATPNVAAGKMAYLAAYLEHSSGTPNQYLEYRLLRSSVEISRWEDSVSDILRDGIHFSYIDKTPGTGAVSYELQTRNMAGASTTFGARSLDIQMIPQLTVFEASGTNFSVPGNGSWYDLVNTGWVSVSPASIGTYGSDGAGFAHFTYNGSFNNEALLQLTLESWNIGWSFEVGVRFVHGSSTGRELEALPSDWEQLGLKTTDQYRMTLQARGLCNTTNLNFSRAHFQVLAVPDSAGFVNPGTCSSVPSVCCSQFPSQCTVYTCEPSGELSQVSASGINCPL